ncbi:MAG TPA: carboxymuconolactone decarboxylase family protein [Acidimicrobiales bacterium]
MPSDDHDAGRPRPAAPRIPPLPPAERDERARDLLERAGGPAAGATNIFATLVRHPGLFRRWLPFGGKLLAGELPPRDRELLILRTAWNCRSPYEWGQHVRIARSAGVADADIERVAHGPAAEGWSAHDALLMAAADELHGDACVSDRTWAALADRYDERQLIEVPMLVGHYHLVAFALNSLGVQLEDGAAPDLPGPA